MRPAWSSHSFGNIIVPFVVWTLVNHEFIPASDIAGSQFTVKPGKPWTPEIFLECYCVIVCAQTSPVPSKGNTWNVQAGYDQPLPTKSNDNYLDHTAPQRDKSHFRNLLSKGLFAWRWGTPDRQGNNCGGSPHLSCKHDQIIMRDYMDRRVTPPKWVT